MVDVDPVLVCKPLRYQLHSWVLFISMMICYAIGIVLYTLIVYPCHKLIEFMQGGDQ